MAPCPSGLGANSIGRGKARRAFQPKNVGRPIDSERGCEYGGLSQSSW